jgi:hypothetical protein
MQQVADALQSGKSAYVHREHHEVIPMGDPENDPSVDPDVHEILEIRIAEAGDSYIHIDLMPTKESLTIQQAYIDRVRDQELWLELGYAIKRPNPFRNFRQLLKKYPEDYARWKRFRNKRMLKYIEEQLALIE